MKKFLSILLVVMLVISMFPATIVGAAAPASPVKYSFSSYAVGTQYAQGENHKLDDNVTLTINGAHLNTQVRLYAGSNAVFTAADGLVIDAITLTAGNKAGTLTVSYSDDGKTWTPAGEQKTTTSYTAYEFDIPGDGYKYVQMASTGAQIRVSIATITYAESGGEVVPSCDHSADKQTKTEEKQEPTCTDVGYEAKYTCECGEEFGGKEIPALGHNFIGGVCVRENCGEEQLVVESATYVFANYPAGVQYAENEEHVLDDNVKIYTTESHFTTELRIYSSSTHDGFAIIQSQLPINAITVDGGNKTDTLNVFGSNDGQTWTQIAEISVTSSYSNEESAKFEKAYNWIKLDVAGVNQLRLKSMTLAFDVSAEEPKAIVGEDYTTAKDALANGCTVLKFADENAVSLDVTLDDANKTRYVALEADEEGYYTYYELDLRPSAISLRTGAAGIYYTAQITSADLLAAIAGRKDVTYGIALSLEGAPNNEDNGQYTTIQGVPNGNGEEFLSGSVFNIFNQSLSPKDNKSRGERVIYASAYITIGKQTFWAEADKAWSLRSVVEKVNENLDTLDLSAEQKDALYGFYDTWKGAMDLAGETGAWSVAKIKALGA